MILLSFTGTLRLVLLLLIAWLVLRILIRASSPRTPGAQRRGFNWTAPEQRPKGDVRIERTDGKPDERGTKGPVEDADYEEIK